MKLFKKTYFLIYPLIFTLIFLLFKQFEIFNNVRLIVVVSTVISFILSPKVKLVDKQNGEEEQIRWLFFKKVINKKI